MNIKKRIPSIHWYEDTNISYILPSINSHEGLCVPQLIADYGNIFSKVTSLPRVGKYLVGSLRELKKSYKGVNVQPKMVSKEISSLQLSELKEYIHTLGVDDIGFTTVSPSDIFSNQKIVYQNAIVVLIQMDHDIIKKAPSKQSEREIFRTYYTLNVAVNKIKKYLNEHNFHAEAGPALGGEVNYPVLAQRAGLGAIGKHGLLITPNYGPTVRLAAVYTDIENLPIANSNDHLWVKDFCNDCNACVRSCPSQAIYRDTLILEDSSETHINYQKCAVPFSKNHGCSICINSCTFFHSPYNKIKDSYLHKSS